MPIREMDSAAALVLFALLIAFAGEAAASCRKMANEDMLEYSCEGGHPADLTTIPETTEKLRITRMPLRRITADTFSRFGGNLWVLGCSHCEITDIDADAFRRLVNLQQLSLDSNRLTAVRASWFEGLDSLTYVDLNYNDIRDIEDGVYRNLPGLVDFRISGNRLRCLNLDEMSRLRELKRMFLSENSEFACPHAVSKFLENHGVAFEQDPEWRMLASDIIDVHVPPSRAEEDSETVPAYRERFHPDRRPPPEESEGPYDTRDKTIYPDHSGYRSRHRRPPTTTVRPTTKLPRVEPIYPAIDIRSSYVPSESSSQVIPYPYSTPEMPRAPPPEDIRMSGTDESSRTEDILTYPSYIPTHETTTYWSHPTPERPRTSVTLVPLSEDTRMSGADWPPQTERVPTYPPYIPTHETMPYPSYTTERSRVGSKFSEDETIEESGRSPQAGNTKTYPLYTTYDGLEGTPHGFIQMTRPSSGDSDMVTLRTWSTDHSIEPDDPSWTQGGESHEQSRHPAGGSDRSPSWSTNTPDPRKTPYYGHDPREMIVEGPSSRIDDDVSVATDRSRPATTPPDMHYVRPSPHSPPELVHSSSTDGSYQAPHYKATVTVHPPFQNYRDGDGSTGVRAMETTTTDKPLPECPENSASTTRPVTVLVTLVVVTVFGHVVVERF